MRHLAARFWDPHRPPKPVPPIQTFPSNLFWNEDWRWAFWIFRAVWNLSVDVMCQFHKLVYVYVADNIPITTATLPVTSGGRTGGLNQKLSIRANNCCKIIPCTHNDRRKGSSLSFCHCVCTELSYNNYSHELITSGLQEIRPLLDQKHGIFRLVRPATKKFLLIPLLQEFVRPPLPVTLTDMMEAGHKTKRQKSICYATVTHHRGLSRKGNYWEDSILEY